MTTKMRANHQNTYQSVELGSKDGNKLLRKIIKDGGWVIKANAPDFEVQFVKDVRGGIGDSDVRIEIDTDLKISKPSKTGTIQSFDDAEPVIIPAPKWVTLTDGATFARLYLAGFTCWTIQASAGSTHSSKHGLSFVSLVGVHPSEYGSVTLGGETIYKDGKCICIGSVS